MGSEFLRAISCILLFFFLLVYPSNFVQASASNTHESAADLHRTGPEKRMEACNQNVRALTKAIKSYSNDFTVEVKELNRELLNTLLKKEYIKALPIEPGTRDSDSWKCYALASNGRAFCLNHGFSGLDHPTFRPDLSPFQQLVLTKEKNKYLRARASSKDPLGNLPIDTTYQFIDSFQTFFIKLILAITFFIWVPYSINRTYRFRSFKLMNLIVVCTSIILFLTLRDDPGVELIFVFLMAVLFTVDLSFWALRLLILKKTMRQFISCLKIKPDEFDDERELLYNSTFKRLTKKYSIIIASMGSTLIILIALYIWTITCDLENVNLALPLIFTSLVALSVGVLTGVVRFIVAAVACDKGPYVVTIFTVLKAFLMMVVTGMAVFLTYSSICDLPYNQMSAGLLSPFIISIFMVGRGLSIILLNWRFMTALESLRTPVTRPVMDK